MGQGDHTGTWSHLLLATYPILQLKPMTQVGSAPRWVMKTVNRDGSMQGLNQRGGLVH